jgi:hypothetical protein
MTDDGRVLNWNDLMGRNIKFRWKVPIQIFRRNGTYFPEDDGEVAAMLDVGYYVGNYYNSKTQRYMIEMIDGEEFEGDSRKPLYTYDNSNIDMDYVRKQYFQQETDSKGWFGGALDGDISKIPEAIAKKTAETLGTTTENIKKGAKYIGLCLLGGTLGFGYLYWKAHQTNVNVNISGKKKSITEPETNTFPNGKSQQINNVSYKDEERQMRKDFKNAIVENCKQNNFSTKAKISSVQQKYERLRAKRAEDVAREKINIAIGKIKERNICK